jgi:rhodanese-related sulfurtransferase
VRELSEAWLDILTGHAAARFNYVDVRIDAEFAQKPPRYQVTHIPLQQLRARAPHILEGERDVIVYGSTDSESEEGERILRELGFEKAKSFEGGFDALTAAGLI